MDTAFDQDAAAPEAEHVHVANWGDFVTVLQQIGQLQANNNDLLQQLLDRTAEPAHAPNPNSNPNPNPNPNPQTPAAPSVRLAKIKEPSSFTGKVSEVITFVTEMRQRFSYNPAAYPTEYHKCMYFGSYLASGAPKQWFQGCCEADPVFLEDFDNFVEAFKRHFGDSDLQGTVRRQLNALKQMGSAATYAARFRELVVHLDLTEQSKVDMFFKGLKESVGYGLTIAGKPSTIDDLISHAIKLDNDLYQYNTNTKKKSSAQDHSKPRDHTPKAPTSSHTTTTTSHSQSTSSDVVPMDIDAVRTAPRGPLSAAERQRRLDNKLCLYCGEAGHLVSACPKSKSRPKTDRKEARISAVEDSSGSGKSSL